MKRDPSIRRIRAAAGAKPPARHSETYKWLRDRHRDLAVILARFKPGWETIRAEIEAAGVRDRKGRAPDCDSIRRIWRRVCEDVAASEEDQRSKARERKKVNRSPRHGGPPPIVVAEDGGRPLPSAPAPRPVKREPPQVARPEPVRGEEVELTPEAREELEKLDRAFERADAWAGPRIGRRRSM